MIPAVNLGTCSATTDLKTGFGCIVFNARRGGGELLSNTSARETRLPLNETASSDSYSSNVPSPTAMRGNMLLKGQARLFDPLKAIVFFLRRRAHSLQIQIGVSRRRETGHFDLCRRKFAVSRRSDL